MKIRNGFVSNSSSSSFVFVIDTAYKKDEPFVEMFNIITKLLCMSKICSAEIADRWEKEKFGNDVEVWSFSMEYGSEERYNPNVIKQMKYVKKTFDEN